MAGDLRACQSEVEMDAPIKVKPLADLRDYLAEERTFLAWIRTGIALMAFGFVVARFGIFGDEPHITHNYARGEYRAKTGRDPRWIKTHLVVRVSVIPRSRSRAFRI